MISNIGVAFVLFLSCANAREFLDPVVKLNTNPNNKVNVSDPWLVKWFQVKLDHFTYSNTKTFPMKWLWNNTFYKPGGAIFFYTGNEGEIEKFATATGMLWDLAPMFNAAIIFAEHRYYGATKPFGNLSYASFSNLGFLSSEQALADYAALIYELKTPNNAFNYSYPKDTPVIAFGGSYGGMLSAWMRMKYPHLITGAWSSSALLLYFKGSDVDPGTFDSITTKTYLDAGCNRFIVANCWNAILNLSSTENGRKFLNSQLQIDPKSQIRTKRDAWKLNNYFREAMVLMALMDYPYETSFLTRLPPWPVKAACLFMTTPGTNYSDEDLAMMIYKVANIFYNTTATLQYNCIDVNKCEKQPSTSLGDASLAWPWQECTEIIIETCAKGGHNDFFWDECGPKSQGRLEKMCRPIFKSFNWTTADWYVSAVPMLYGLTVEYASNIILTQGSLDPSSGGGYKASSPDVRNDHGVYAIQIPGNAHHLDLRTPNNCDPNTVTNARYQIVQILKCWIHSCSTPVKLSSLPDLVMPPMGTYCKDINYGYPWGQRSVSNSPTLYISVVCTLLLRNLLF